MAEEGDVGDGDDQYNGQGDGPQAGYQVPPLPGLALGGGQAGILGNPTQVEQIAQHDQQHDRQDHGQQKAVQGHAGRITARIMEE